MLTERFKEYFNKDVAETAAKSLADGVEIEIQVDSETLVFTRVAGKNDVKPGPANEPQLLFTMTPQAAESILTDSSTTIGDIGVNIMKLVVSSDANRRVGVKFKAGFLTLWSKGYFGVLTAGGSQFASYLASRGLSGMGAIKAALSKMKKGE